MRLNPAKSRSNFVKGGCYADLRSHLAMTTSHLRPTHNSLVVAVRLLRRGA